MAECVAAGDPASPPARRSSGHGRWPLAVTAPSLSPWSWRQGSSRQIFSRTRAEKPHVGSPNPRKLGLRVGCVTLAKSLPAPRASVWAICEMGQGKTEWFLRSPLPDSVSAPSLLVAVAFLSPFEGESRLVLTAHPQG